MGGRDGVETIRVKAWQRNYIEWRARETERRNIVKGGIVSYIMYENLDTVVVKGCQQLRGASLR